MILLKTLFFLYSHFLDCCSTFQFRSLKLQKGLRSSIRTIVFLTFLLTAVKGQALPFDTSCRLKLFPAENLDTVVDLVINSDLHLETRVQTLFTYITQNRPKLLTQDIEEILDFILLNDQYTDFIADPSTIFEALNFLISYNSDRSNLVLKTKDLSMQSQILLWLLDTHITDYSNIENALRIGNIHRFILGDIKRLRPGQNDHYYKLSLTRVLSLNLR